MFLLITILATCLILVQTDDTQVQGKVKGDSTVGGFHFLEIHAGTAEFGLKIVLFALLIAGCVYMYLRFKAKMAKRKRVLAPLLNQLAASYQVNPEALALALPYGMAPVPDHRRALPQLPLQQPPQPPQPPPARRPPRDDEAEDLYTAPRRPGPSCL